MKPLPALFALFLSTLAANAATFEGRRGMSLDIWDTWPQEKTWGDETVLLPFPEWKRYIGKTELQSLQQSGLDFVRIPVDPAPFLSDASAALQDRLYDEVIGAIDLALDANLGALVDIHPIPAGERTIGTSEILNDPAKFEAYLAFLRRMAASIKDQDPKRVALEVFNEPTIDCDSDGTNNWPGLMKQAFAAARSSATKLTLVLSGACWGGAEGLARIDAKDIADDNIIWSFHSYDPFILTHQGATWAGDFATNVYGLPFPLHDLSEEERSTTIKEVRDRLESLAPADKRSGHLSFFDKEIAKIETKEGLDSEMEKSFAIVANWAKANGIDPQNIILGEFGMIRQEYGNTYVVPAKSRAAYYQMQVERAGRHGFRWAAFSYSGAFGMVRGWNGATVEPPILPTAN